MITRKIEEAITQTELAELGTPPIPPGGPLTVNPTNRIDLEITIPGRGKYPMNQKEIIPDSIQEAIDLLQNCIKCPTYLIFGMRLVILGAVIAGLYLIMKSYQGIIDLSASISDQEQDCFTRFNTTKYFKPVNSYYEYSTCNTGTGIDSLSDFKNANELYLWDFFHCNQPILPPFYYSTEECCDIVSDFFKIPSPKEMIPSLFSMKIAAIGLIAAIELLSYAAGKCCLFNKEPRFFCMTWRTSLSSYLKPEQIASIKEIATTYGIDILEDDIMRTLRNFKKAYSCIENPDERRVALLSFEGEPVTNRGRRFFC